MKSIVYTIADLKANRSIAPLVRDNDEIAIRDFTNMINATPGPDNPFAQNPEDFTLYRIGTWDDETRELQGRDAYRLCNGNDVKTSQEPLEEKIEQLEHELSLVRAQNDNLELELAKHNRLIGQLADDKYVNGTTFTVGGTD